MDGSYIHINYSILFACISALVLVIAASFFVPKQEEKVKWKFKLISFACLSFLYVTARVNIPTTQDASAWNGANNLGNIYKDYTNTTKSLLLSGVYEYAFRDIYLAYNPFYKINNKDVIKELDNYYINQSNEHTINDKSSILENKNAMIIQLENIDEWMLTKENMPNLYALKENSIDFEHHYATSFATGKTFNTEFIVNTGMIPQTKGSAPSSIYSRNSYPYSLANNFKNAGYTVNSYHASSGHVYNREAVHKTFGYNSYNNYEAMAMDDYTMDSQMINGYEKMTTADKYMDFIITYSGHGPFDPEYTTCSTHLDEVKTYTDSDDIVYLCGLAQAKETDSFIGNLINKMQEDGSIDTTALVFYTDHYAYATIDEETEMQLKGTNDPNLLSNVPFFVWSKDIVPEKVDKVTGTIDILPTISNLFGFDTGYQYYIGNDIFSEYDDYVFFQDGNILSSEAYLISSNLEVEDKYKEQIQDMNIRLSRSWNMLSIDYFAHSKIAKAMQEH